MTEPDDTDGSQTDDASERIVNRRAVLGLVGAPAALGSLAYLGEIGGDDDRWAPNALEYALSSRVEWALDTSFSSRPTVADGTIYIREDDRAYALATADGTEQWRVEISDDYALFPFPTTVAAGVVYESSRRGQLFALEATDGSERWTAALGDYAAGPPTVAGDTVYLGCDDTMYALDPAAGSTRWSVELRNLKGSPVVTDDTVYVGSDWGVHALDTADGAERWTTEVDGVYTRVSAQAGDTLYASGVHRIYALDAADGAERWRVEIPTWFDEGLAVADDTVYASVDGGPLYKIEPDGDATILFQVEEGLSSPPSFADGTIYVGSNAGDHGGHLHAVDTAEGTERWSFPVGDTDSAPVVADGTVYVTGDSLFALEA